MPIDAIRQSKEIKLTGKKVKTARLTRILFGFEGEIALKNLKRNRKKYRATVLSLIISIVLFLTVSNYASILKETSQVSTEGYNFDIWVRSSNSSVEDIKNVYSKISGLDLVTESSTIKTSLGHMLLDASQVSETLKQIVTQNDQTKYDLSAQFYCLDENSFDTYAKSIGVDPDDYQNESTPKAIAINYAKNIGDDKYTAGEALSMKPGQQVEILSFASDEEKQPTGMNLTLGAITSQRPMGVLNSSYHTISFIVSEKVFLPLSSKLSDEPQDPDQNLFLNTSDSDKLEKQINDFSKELSKGELFVTNITAKAKSEQDMLLFLGVFVYGFIILISLICLANIFNTISTNIALRRKEFAMLRSVGMTPQGFNKMIRFESIFYGMKALLYGLPLSVVVSLLLFRFQENSFDLGFIFPWVSYCVGIVLIFIIVTATMLYSSAKIKKENIIDALKEENM
jgi:putative ABC transport system permease protein